MKEIVYIVLYGKMEKGIHKYHLQHSLYYFTFVLSLLKEFNVWQFLYLSILIRLSIFYQFYQTCLSFNSIAFPLYRYKHLFFLLPDFLYIFSTCFTSNFSSFKHSFPPLFHRNFLHFWHKDYYRFLCQKVWLILSQKYHGTNRYFTLILERKTQLYIQGTLRKY